MKYRKLGRNEIEVSEIALGCEGFNHKTLEETKELLKYTFEKGINFIDFYSSNPELRTNFGTAMKELGIRKEYVIENVTTKTSSRIKIDEIKVLTKSKNCIFLKTENNKLLFFPKTSSLVSLFFNN